MPKPKISFEPQVGQAVEIVDKGSTFYGLGGKITSIDEDVRSIEVEIEGHGKAPFWPEELQPLEA